MTPEDLVSRWGPVAKMVLRPGPFTGPARPSAAEFAGFLNECKVLVVGAGGLGCEILKNLALTGFRRLHVIDMDTIDVSNLNRQFLFRLEDVGRPKAVVAAEFVNRRVKGAQVVPHYAKIQDKDEDFYHGFDMIVCGLDSVEARRWINATLVNLADPGDPSSTKPLVDGGTEGFKGQTRVIVPGETSCYECSFDMLGKPTTYPLCTIAHTPRLPEHCIEWASVLEWPRVFNDKKLDADNPEHLSWLYETALSRARHFKIEGVTYQLTQGVVKNIIPAVSSTNAVIAASCCLEALKIATLCGPRLDNYMMYSGTDGIYTYTFQHQRLEDCAVCGRQEITANVSRAWTVLNLLEWIKAGGEGRFGLLKRPSLRTASRSIYMPAPPSLELATRPNLEKPVSEFAQEGEIVSVTDALLPIALSLTVQYVD